MSRGEMGVFRKSVCPLLHGVLQELASWGLHVHICTVGSEMPNFPHKDQRTETSEPSAHVLVARARSFLVTGCGIYHCLYSVKPHFEREAFIISLCSLQLFDYITTNPLRENSRVSVQGSSQRRQEEDRQWMGLSPPCRKLGALR